MNIAVFVSGNGTNLQALIDAQSKGDLSEGCIKLVVCDKPGVFALERAKETGIKTFVLEPKDFDKREDFDKEILKVLEKEKIELIVLAGFMRLLSGCFIQEYKNKILNVHPSLLPSFKGVNGIRKAFEYGVKVTGVTVHFVSEKLDEGPIVLQEEVDIKEDETLISLEEKIHEVEHKLYPKAVKMFVDGKLTIDGRIIKVKK